MSEEQALRITITTRKTGQGDKEATKGLDGLKKAATLAVGALAALKGAQQAVDFVKFGASVQRQSMALDNLARSAGTSGAAIVSAIQGASDFTIDRMAAMESANKAMLLQVAQTPDQFERLTTVAVALGRAMGQDATKSIDDFVTAAGRQSKQIADNLGLMVSAEDANAKYAASLGKTVDELTDAERKQAFLNEMLEQGEERLKALGDISGGAATDIEKVTAAVNDAKAGFAELAVEGIARTFNGVDELVSRIRRLPEAFGQAVTLVRAASDTLRDYQTYQTGSINVMEVYRSNLTDLVRVQVGANTAFENAAFIERNLVGATHEASAAQREYFDALRKTEQGISGYSAVSYAAADATGAYRQSQEEISYIIASATEAMEANRLAMQQQAEAAGALAVKHADLAARLMEVEQAEIASAAIRELGGLLDEDKITAGEYATAVQETQLAFGLATEESIRLSEGVLGLVARFGEGKVSADQFDESLKDVILQASTGTSEVNELASAISAMPDKKTITIETRYTTTGKPPSGVTVGGGNGSGGGGGGGGAGGGEIETMGLLPMVPTLPMGRIAPAPAGGSTTYNITIYNQGGAGLSTRQDVRQLAIEIEKRKRLETVSRTFQG